MKLRDIAIGANASMYYRMDFERIKGVFYPRSESDVVQAIRFANKHGYDVTPKGGGSGLSGACTGGNTDRIMISSLRLNELLTIAKDKGFIDVQAGATPDQINAVLQEIGMRLWVSPSSRDIATVGGILSTDGGGNDTWINGTMRDNTLRVKMILYNGEILTVDWNGVKCSNRRLEDALNKMKMSIHDVASSHGLLGFITELRLKIKPLKEVHSVGGISTFSDYNHLGSTIDRLVKDKAPVYYGESIIHAHKDIRGDLRPPLMILEFDEGYIERMKEIAEIRILDKTELEIMKEIRIKLPKRNPKQGIQVALFEGFGFYNKSLLKMKEVIDEIDSLLESRGLVPFTKYGHAPSKWYLGDNTAAYGIIMHSREIKPEKQSGKDLYKTLMEIVTLCEELQVTPKPEHKWPYRDVIKNQRLRELRDIIGSGFNSFILSADCDSTLETMA